MSRAKLALSPFLGGPFSECNAGFPQWRGLAETLHIGSFPQAKECQVTLPWVLRLRIDSKENTKDCKRTIVSARQTEALVSVIFVYVVFSFGGGNVKHY